MIMTATDIWPSGPLSVQLWRNLVGFGRKHALLAVQAHVSRQHRRPLCRCASIPSALWQWRVEGTYYRCQPADIQQIHPRKDGICNEQDCHECADQGIGDGF